MPEEGALGNPGAARVGRAHASDGAQQGQGGFAGLLTDQARRSGVAGYPSDGTQRWPAVHALDAAVLFRLAMGSVPDDSFGPFGSIFAMDQPATSTHTRATLGWHPTHPSLLDDLENLQS